MRVSQYSLFQQTHIRIVTNLLTAKCIEGDVRLGLKNFTEFYISIGEEKEYYFIKDELARGRLEVCVGERYGTISDTNWSNQDASVACSQLGFSRYGLSLIPLVSLPVYMWQFSIFHLRSDCSIQWCIW